MHLRNFSRVFASLAVLVAVSGCNDQVLNPYEDDTSTGSVPDDDLGPGPDDDSSVDPRAEDACDGLDSDGDGVADEGYPDTDGDGLADCIDTACDLDFPEAGDVAPLATCGVGAISVPDPWNVTILWQWKGSADHPSYREVQTTPLVARLEDSNGNGLPDDGDLPDVVFVAHDGNDGALVAVRGDGSTLWQVLGDVEAPIDLSASPAAADIDGDGWAEVVAFSGGEAVAYDRTGALLWRSGGPPDLGAPGAAIADLDGDGAAEVVGGTIVLDGSTGDFLARLGHQGAYGPPTVGDIDLDGVQEVIVGGVCYRPDGTELWGNFRENNTGAALGNFDDDAEAEVIVGGTWGLYRYEHDGSETWSLLDSYSSDPSVADFDGDGQQEIAVSTGTIVQVVEGDGVASWSTPVADVSGLAATSAADLDADGAYEVLFADEDCFRVFDGVTGVERFSDCGHASATQWEYPSIADLNQDGSAEVIVANNSDLDPDAHGITIYHHAGSGWAPVGVGWSQDAFAPGAVGDDGTLPAAAPIPWLDTGLFRARPVTSGHDQADLTARIADACAIACPVGVMAVAVQVANQGLWEVPAGTAVSLYRLDGGGRTLLDTRTLPTRLPAGRSSEPLEFVVSTLEFGTDGLLAVADDSGGGGMIGECDETNNQATWTEPVCPSPWDPERARGR